MNVKTQTRHVVSRSDAEFLMRDVEVIVAEHTIDADKSTGNIRQDIMILWRPGFKLDNFAEYAVTVNGVEDTTHITLGSAIAAFELLIND